MSNNVALALVFIRQNDNRIQLIVSCKWAVRDGSSLLLQLIVAYSFMTRLKLYFEMIVFVFSLMLCRMTSILFLRENM
jgi:hypothetical protein